MRVRAADRLDPVRALHRDRLVVHVDGHRVLPDLDAHLLQALLRVALQLLRERGQHRRRALEQDDPRLLGVDRPVVPGQHGVRELGDLPGQLHPGRTGPDHDEGQPLGPFLRVGGDLGHLELGQDRVPDVPGVLHGLHARGELGEVVLAEVGVGGAGGHHQGVVGQVHRATVRTVRPHDLRVQIEVVHVGQQGLGVALLLDHAAQGRRDQAGRQDPGRHLVQQRLEQMMVGPVDDGHLDVCPVQRADGGQPTEPAPDDDDPLTSHGAPPRMPCTRQWSAHPADSCPTAVPRRGSSYSRRPRAAPAPARARRSRQRAPAAPR